jgi:hypothetical protein
MALPSMSTPPALAILSPCRILQELYPQFPCPYQCLQTYHLYLLPMNADRRFRARKHDLAPSTSSLTSIRVFRMLSFSARAACSCSSLCAMALEAPKALSNSSLYAAICAFVSIRFLSSPLFSAHAACSCSSLCARALETLSNSSLHSATCACFRASDCVRLSTSVVYSALPELDFSGENTG